MLCSFAENHLLRQLLVVYTAFASALGCQTTSATAAIAMQHYYVLTNTPNGKVQPIKCYIISFAYFILFTTFCFFCLHFFVFFVFSVCLFLLERFLAFLVTLFGFLLVHSHLFGFFGYPSISGLIFGGIYSQLASI